MGVKRVLQGSSIIAAALLLLLLASMAFAGVPNKINYQGRMTNVDGSPVADAVYQVIFRIYDDSTSTDPLRKLWEETDTVETFKGLFDIILGGRIPIDMSIFDGRVLYLALQPQGYSELTPRTKLVSVPYSGTAQVSASSEHAKYADTAEVARQGRELYHQIMDINPNSTTTIPIITRAGTHKVTLYLYGSEFQGTLAAHTHAGINPHTHSMTGVVGIKTVPHYHGYSGTSTNSGANHTHSGTTLSFNLGHTHSGTTNTDGAHHHDLLIHGYAQNGFYIVHRSEVNSLTADGGPATSIASMSVDQNQSNHQHNFTTNSSLGNHSHDFTSGTASANHSHDYSGNTTTVDISHSHTFTGTINSYGSGLNQSGILANALPSNVRVYVDGAPAGGPFNGEFNSGELDLTAMISGPGEHLIEIREEGGTGGRITYNIFVE
ncbi:exported hypothetical protein [Candidatus Zixiibacteriota bacterium]|nr:exported hypothetical protein [candidate division Zixibacteria bacterium]